MATPQHHRLILDTGPPAPLSTETRENGSYGFEANFDTNMVIVLAALLCALIGALGLNSVIRCALRCGHRFAFQSPDEASTRLATTGLKKRVLRKIPVTVYGSEMNISATDCPICLGEFVDGEKLRVLPKCNHRFHVSCIDTWLMSHPSCPTCRNSLLERPNTSNVAANVDAGIRQLGNASGEQRDVVVIIGEVGSGPVHKPPTCIRHPSEMFARESII